jgi:hypothetical protein
MNHQTRATGNLEQRIHDAERNLFADVGDEWRKDAVSLAGADIRQLLDHT